ncbi:Putative sucrose-phosphate synthase [Desulfonema limicola]|uniref:sucrose-phosphate synthase n=1 Tax=Desulfonema limicola TaxID=45656 RepID=A0A975BAZ1_9BACT|nr:HAD-IIB family hydrolase [Desulfonema limicola]QTA82012.1 Putative sucrose-phosphate synthase [Desulfonema limicola]
MKKKGLYIQMFSIHGLLRAENMEMGRDADTGGQINYVVELARALSQIKNVRQIDLFTRLISDKTVSEDYSRPVEQVNEKFRIVRIRCGGLKYIRKELLWPHLDEYVDKTISFIKKENMLPDIVHGHYPDAGYIAMELAQMFGIPFIYTGHSLGRVKKQKLLAQGMKEADIIKKFRIDTRIEKEEDILEFADMVITSTNQEIKEQYGMYRNKDLPSYILIPPGLDIEKFYPYYHDLLPENEKDEDAMYAKASVIKELDRFFTYPDKPLILSICRPDKRKNIQGLVKAYGEDKELQLMANLAIFAGIRKDIVQMEENEKNVLTEMLLLMDKYDLYGKMAIPKKHNFQHEVPELYRITGTKRGVFINPALTEPFGLTLLEASAAGVPIVATNDGGPNDIIKNCQNGLLVDPEDTKAIAGALKKIITEPDKWDVYSKNGIQNVRKFYTWLYHGEQYLKQIEKLFSKIKEPGIEKTRHLNPIGKRLASLNHFIVSDIDNTLIGEHNPGLEELIKLLDQEKNRIGFAVATGRTVNSAVEYLQEHNVPVPDIVISSVGSEIYYGKILHYDKGWETHISSKWKRDRIFNLLKQFDFLEYQEESCQRQFKISYNMEPGKDRLTAIHNLLLKNKCRSHLVYSHEKYLDILPYRASKGKAIRYLSYKWEIPLNNFLVCGDSGNDEEMLRGEPLGVVVGNFSPELQNLKGHRRIYFANQNCALGILEAVKKYNFLEKTKN